MPKAGHEGSAGERGTRRPAERGRGCARLSAVPGSAREGGWRRRGTPPASGTHGDPDALRGTWRGRAPTARTPRGVCRAPGCRRRGRGARGGGPGPPLPPSLRCTPFQGFRDTPASTQQRERRQPEAVTNFLLHWRRARGQRPDETALPVTGADFRRGRRPRIKVYQQTPAMRNLWTVTSLSSRLRRAFSALRLGFLKMEF